MGAVSSGSLRFAGHYLPFFAGQLCSLCLLDLRRCRSCLLRARQPQPRDVSKQVFLLREKVFLPRFKLIPTEDGTFPFRWSRWQFPVKVAFAQTINKSQGQTVKRVGVRLQEPVFSHGQLYVAVSRVGHPENIRLAIPRHPWGETYEFVTRNIVYQEVLW